jgi:hypothetical protein
VCILDSTGRVVLEGRVGTSRERFAALLGRRSPARVSLEASTESEWVADRRETSLAGRSSGSRRGDDRRGSLTWRAPPLKQKGPTAFAAGVPGRDPGFALREAPAAARGNLDLTRAKSPR